jgi:hypothetical protein
VLVEVLQPDHGRVYDPCCGSGGMFVQAEKFIYDHHGDPQNIKVYGQELNERTWRMAKMNLAIHGIENSGIHTRWGDTFVLDYHADKQMDFVMANPPFNIKDWNRIEKDPRWRYGVPPAGNANYAWIQHILSKLTDDGRAGVVMANGSMSSNSGGEGEIRARIVEADLVSCMVALPTQLFRSTGIPVCLWFFAKDKSAGKQGATDRTGQVLFIDARELGFMVDRAERSLAAEDIARIAETFHAWRGSSSAVASRVSRMPTCRVSAPVVSLADIKAAEYALTPGRYVGAAEVEDDGEPIDAKIERLTRILRVADVGDGAVRADGPDFVSEDFVRQIGPKAARAGDVLLTTKGTVGRVAIMPEHTEPVVYSPQLCYFRILDPSRLSARWLAYWFKSGEFLMQASHRANNTDMAAYINLADIRSLVLPDVDVRKQRGIAEVLGALDDKIAANRRAERASVELIGALYKRAVEGGARCRCSCRARSKSRTPRRSSRGSCDVRSERDERGRVGAPGSRPPRRVRRVGAAARHEDRPRVGAARVLGRPGHAVRAHGQRSSG